MAISPSAAPLEFRGGNRLTSQPRGSALVSESGAVGPNGSSPDVHPRFDGPCFSNRFAGQAATGARLGVVTSPIVPEGRNQGGGFRMEVWRAEKILHPAEPGILGKEIAP